MLSSSQRKNQAKRGPTKYRGISTDARKLGFSRVHLWMVLEGTVKNPDLLERYYVLHPEARPRRKANNN